MRLRRRTIGLWPCALSWALGVGCSQTPTEAPTTEAPTTEAPTTEAPTTEAPTAETPTPLVEPPLATAEGGQTGSGGLPPLYRCDDTPEVQEGCGLAIRAQMASLYFEIPLKRTECVPASAIDPAYSDDTPICRCYYDAQDNSDRGEQYETWYTVGLAHRRQLLGEAGDSCEQRINHLGAPNTCLLEASDFSGCSLEDPRGSCDDGCAFVADANRRTVEALMADLTLLDTECVSDCPSRAPGGACLAAFRLADQCWVGAAGFLQDGSHLSAVSCDQTPEQMIQSQCDQTP
jgi:hypothetical protein